MKTEDVAWAAGLLEGEGCFSIHTRKDTNYTSCAIHCEMVDEDIIRRLPRIFNVGTVNIRKNMSGRRDPSWRQQTAIWSVQNFKGVQLVLNAVLPHLGERRSAKAKELLNFLDTKLEN